MNNDRSLYEKFDMMNSTFPIIMHFDHLYKGQDDFFPSHWHEKIEFLYFTKGEGVITCNTSPITVAPGTLVVVNSNELHQGTSISEVLEYYCIIVDTSIFQINPIFHNRILFENKIENNLKIKKCIYSIIDEFKNRKIGFELSVKSSLFTLMVLLLRKYVNQFLTPVEYDLRMKNLQKLNGILQYIDENYFENMTINSLCVMANLSRYYFCHLFKETTGKSVNQFINITRISKAEAMLKDSGANITEAAMACGFNDANYFSRIYKKYKNKTPSRFIEESGV